MKTQILLLAAATTLLFSCAKEKLVGTGPEGSKTFTVPAFSSVESHYNIAANISYGAVQDVTITGYNNLLNALDIRVENGVLKLAYDRRYSSIRNDNLVATIKVPSLNKATIHGSKNIAVSGFWQTPQFTAGIFGSGNITITESSFEKLTTDIYGSGDIDAMSAECQELSANVYGSGNTSTTAMNKITAKIYGSGNVYYKGTPTIAIEKFGSGSVIKK